MVAIKASRRPVERLVAAAQKLKVGNGLEDGIDMGPAVDDRQRQTEIDYIEIGKGEGAQLLLGGKRPDALSHGYFVEPTVFAGVKPAMRIPRKRSSARCSPS